MLEVSQTLLKAFSKQGIDCRVSTRVDQIDLLENGVSLALHSENGDESIEAESVILAIGVVPNLNGVLGENCKPELSRGYPRLMRTI